MHCHCFLVLAGASVSWAVFEGMGCNTRTGALLEKIIPIFGRIENEASNAYVLTYSWECSAAHKSWL